MEALERRVLLVDDHRSFAEALAIAIDAQHGLRCVAVAATAAEALTAVTSSRPNIALVDMRLPDSSGPALIGQLHAARPELTVLALTAFADAASVSAAARAGVSGFLRKECSVRDIVATLRTAGDGPMVIDNHTLGAMMRRTTPRAEATAAVPGGIKLTARELEVLEMLSDAFDAQGIAKHLGISIHTARGYVKSLLAKFEVHTQLELVVRARKLGMLDESASWAHGEASDVALRVG